MNEIVAEKVKPVEERRLRGIISKPGIDPEEDDIPDVSEEDSGAMHDPDEPIVEVSISKSVSYGIFSSLESLSIS
jgi:hypothetical protein